MDQLKPRSFVKVPNAEEQIGMGAVLEASDESPYYNDPYLFAHPSLEEETAPSIKPEAPGFFDKMAAYYRQEDGTIAFIRDSFDKASMTSSEYDPNYLPNIKGTKYENYGMSFLETYNAEDEARVKSKIDEEEVDKRIIADGGWTGTAAGLAAGIISPLSLIPFGAATKVYAGGNLLKGALITARAGLLASTSNEVLLHNMQESRTLGESASNVAAATLLSAVLGGAVGRVRDTKVKKAVGILEKAEKGGLTVAESLETKLIRDTDDFLTLPTEGTPDLMTPNSLVITEKIENELFSPIDFLSTGDGSAGSARVIDDFKLKNVLGAEKLEIWNPLMRTLTSGFPKAAKYTTELAEVPYIFAKNAEGFATKHSAETRIKSLHTVTDYKILRETADSYAEYRGLLKYKAENKIKNMFENVTGTDKLSFDDFKIEIDRALRNGDESDIPEVAATARKFREIIDPVYREAVKLGIIDEGDISDTAVSWMTRVYDKSAIRKNMGAWRAALRAGMLEKNPALDRLELEDIIRTTTNKILGAPDDISLHSFGGKGQFKERALRVHDDFVQDFLIRDPDVTLTSYLKGAMTEIELKKSGFDDEGLKLKLEDITQEANEIKAQIENKLEKKYNKKIAEFSEKENAAYDAAINKVNKNLKSTQDDIQGMRDRIRGTFQLNPDSIYQSKSLPLTRETLKAWNYSRLLGGVVFSSFADLGMPVLINGFSRTMKDQLAPFVRNLNVMAKNLGKVKKDSLYHQSVQELRDMGIACEMILNTRVKNYAELGSAITGSKLSTANQKMTKGLSFLSGITAWNDQMRMISGYSAMARILRAAQEKSLTKSDLEFLGRFGVDDVSLKKIGKEFSAHGNKEGGRFASGWEDWKDTDAKNVFQDSIRKFVDQTIIVPGQEKPFFASTGWGSVIMQFRTFTMSAYSKVFIAGLQQRDMAALNGALMMTSLGMLSYYAKTVQAGKEPSEDLEVWLKEGIDRSGLLGHMFDLYNVGSKALPGFAKGDMSRFQLQSATDAVFGPSLGLVGDAFTTGQWASKLVGRGEAPAKSDLRATRRLMPFQNVIILRNLIDKLQDVAGESLGAKDGRRKNKRS